MSRLYRAPGMNRVEEKPWKTRNPYQKYMANGK